MKKHLPALVAASAAATSLSFSDEVLKNQETSWDFLLDRTLLEMPLDPANFDLDFHTTWMNPVALGYDGPPFVTGTGYFGYGTINGSAITTNIWNYDGSFSANEPPSGQRYTAYFVTTVTPTQPVAGLRFTGIIDDGAIVYVNGAELTRINMPPAATAPDSWTLLSDGGGDEDNPVTVGEVISLPAGVPATIAVSMHNTAATSSDMGFDLLIESVTPTAPPNDNFANAIEITGAFPIAVTGTNSDGIGGLGSTKQPGEPNHAGQPGGGSVWWNWTPATSGRVSLSTNGSSFSTLLAVYTGTAVNALTPVSRHANLNVPASSAEEPFHLASRVEFDAVAGTTYRIAVDGAAAAAGSIALTIDSAFTPLDPVALLLPAGSNWEYLLYADAANLPVDPQTVDPDFDTTWHTSALYDGPAFSGPSPALLGYGTINADPIVTDTWGNRDHGGTAAENMLPPTNFRFASYFRTTFTPAAPVVNLGFEGLIDDGAIIYIDGVEAARLNIDSAADASNWQTFALSSNHSPNNVGNEDEPQIAFALGHPLPAGVPVEIAVSLHNPNSTSSDQGFDLRVWSTNEPIEPPVPSNFFVLVEKTAIPEQYQLSWPSAPGAVYDIEFSEDLQSWIPIIFDIPADPSGTNTELDFPSGIPTGFYRVVQR